VEWVRSQPGALDYQYVLRAVRDDAEGAVAAIVAQRAELSEQLAAARVEVEEARSRASRAEAELGALASTVTLRALDRPRRWYSAARRRVGRRGPDVG
jgi:predicted  nucleic acid-binding Zn-ribbon protein